MTPEGEPGVSDFGISSGAVADPSRRAEAGPAGDDPRFELAAEVRRITSAMVGLPLTDSEIAAARVALAAVADRLEQSAGPGRRPRAQPDAVGKPQDFFPTSPVIGFANPVAPPVVVEAVDGGLVGTAWFDYQYEGPPTCVHGGIIAHGLRRDAGGGQHPVRERPGMTGTLTIRYRKPTPLRTTLRLEARFVRRDGRKILTSGTIHHGDVLTAEAEGIFIELVPQEFMKIVGQNTDSPEALEQVRADAQRLGLAERLPPGPPEGSPEGSPDPTGTSDLNRSPRRATAPPIPGPGTPSGRGAFFTGAWFSPRGPGGVTPMPGQAPVGAPGREDDSVGSRITARLGAIFSRTGGADRRRCGRLPRPLHRDVR